jgi:polynucleotide 5'-kinase involved in rRNA processing
MGGRKGYSLKTIVGDIRKIRASKKKLLQGIKDKDPDKIVNASAKILSKSDKSLESLAYSYLFVGSIKKDYNKLRKESRKERRKDLAEKWASFRKEKGKKFDATTNRNVVDSATRVLGGTE